MVKILLTVVSITQMFLLLLLSNYYLNSDATITKDGNEYEQYQKFLEIAPVLDEELYESKIYKCYSEGTNTCGDAVMYWYWENLPHLWEPNISSPAVTRNVGKVSHVRPLEQDCDYDVDSKLFQYQFQKGEYSVTNRLPYRLFIRFSIKQHSCKSGFSKSLGGSSFSVFAEMDYFLTSCSVIDKFDNNYDIECELPVQTDHAEEYCILLNIYLEYEHFDGFNGIRKTMARLSRELGPIENFCVDSKSVIIDTIKTEKTLMNSDRSIADMLAKGLITKHDLLDMAFVDGFWRDYPGTHKPVGGIVWESGIGEVLFPTVKEFKTCIHSRRVVIIGASHMRYTWDFATYAYLNHELLSKFDRIHYDYTFEFFEYISANFAIDVANALMQRVLPYCKSKKPQTIVIMTGAWDTFYSVKHFTFEKVGLKLVNAIKALKENDCGDSVNLIWLPTVPVQILKHQEWRNNFSIKAAMDWLRTEIVAVNYPSLRIVDAYQLMLPTLANKREVSHICNNHYLCHGEYQDDMYQTASGIALTNKILHEACSDFIEIAIESDLDRPPTGTIISITTPNNSSKYYAMRYGLRHEIWGTIALQYFSGNDLSKVIAKDPAEIANIPEGMHFLSRENNHVYYVLPTDELYVMNDSLRHFAASETAIRKKYRIGTIYKQYVSYYDVQEIPLGDPV